MRGAAHPRNRRTIAILVAGLVVSIAAAPSASAAGPVVPPAPRGLMLQGASGNAISIGWRRTTRAVPRRSPRRTSHYVVSLDGKRAGSTQGTSFTLQALTCDTSYTIGVRTVDYAGRRSRATTLAAQTEPCGTTAWSFYAVADARVSQASPASNYGSSSYLRVDGDTDPAVHTYVQFAVSNVTGTTRRATLRLYAKSGTANGPTAYRVIDAWGEKTITWQSRAAPFGPALSDAGGIPPGSWAEWDVTPSISANGKYSFVLVGESRDGVDFRSREAGSLPELIVSTSTDSPPPPADADGDGVPDDLDLCPTQPGPAANNGCPDSGPPPPPPPPPPASDCTKVLNAGGDVSAFLKSLRADDIGCLRGGQYYPASYLAHSSGATVKSFPGERAVIVGQGVAVGGTGSAWMDITIRDATGVDMDCVSVSGTGNRIVGNDLLGCGRHNILLRTNSKDALIQGNFGDRAGLNSSNSDPDHGVYVQGVGHDIVRNVFARMQGYGIHAYSSASGSSGAQPYDISINGNTTIYSALKSGILIRSEAGGDIRTFNNLSAFNHDYGINYYSGGANCPAGSCPIDTNLSYGNGIAGLNSGAMARALNTTVANPLFVDAEFRVSTLSPAIDKARAPFFFADRDGRTDAVADLGAYG